MTYAQQLHFVGIPVASSQAPQRPRRLHAMAVESVGPLPARTLRREAQDRLMARRELRSKTPAPQALAAAAIQRAQQVGRPLTDSRPAPLGD